MSEREGKKNVPYATSPAVSVDAVDRRVAVRHRLHSNPAQPAYLSAVPHTSVRPGRSGLCIADATSLKPPELLPDPLPHFVVVLSPFGGRAGRSAIPAISIFQTPL